MLERSNCQIEDMQAWREAIRLHALHTKINFPYDGTIRDIYNAILKVERKIAEQDIVDGRKHKRR